MTPIYVISLKDSKNREKIKISLSSMNVEYKIIDAIYGKNESPQTIQQAREKSKIIYKRELTHGEIGCTLSHLKIYQEMIDQKIAQAIILEDDAIIDERIKILQEDINFICGKSLYILGGQDGLESKNYILTKKIKYQNTKITFEKSFLSSRFIYRTCSYALSTETAKKIIDEFKSDFFLADDWKRLKKIKCFNDIYITNIVSHPIDLSQSTIEEERSKNTNRTRNKKTHALKAIIKNSVLKLRSILFYKFKYDNR